MKRPIIIAIAIYFSLAMVLLLLWPKYKDFTLIKQRIEKQNNEIKKTNDYFNRLAEINVEITANSDVISKVDSALPLESSPTDLFNFFQKISDDNGLTLKEVSLGSSSNLQGSLSRIKATDFNVIVVGTYPAFKNFITEIERSARLINIENISFSSTTLGSKKAGVISFTVAVKTYNFSE